jgi:hypothetical protein
MPISATAQPISGAERRGRSGSLSGDLDRLARGRKARVQMQVELFGDETGRGLKASTSFCPRSRLARMKRAGTRKSNLPFGYPRAWLIRQAISRMASRADWLTPS